MFENKISLFSNRCISAYVSESYTITTDYDIIKCPLYVTINLCIISDTYVTCELTVRNDIYVSNNL